MTEYIQKIINQVTDFFKKLSKGRRIALVVTVITIVIGFVAVFFWAGETQYHVLGTNLVTEDATAIMRILRDKKIPFRVENDGKTIKIPQDAVYDLRLELAAMGLPQTSIVGYEVFDKQPFGTTSFVQKVNEKRAREGELIRTINNIRGVKRSRVHLALPDRTTFMEDQKQPTASVVIDLEPGVQISDKQVQGIAHLIASSVEGMETKNVIIVDANGKLLSKNHADPLAVQTANMLEFQQKMESEYEKRIEEILARVVGEGKVVSKVALELDFIQQSETQTQYDSEGAAVKAQQKENQIMDGSRPVPSGAPGAASNTPGVPPQPNVTEARSNTQKVFETTNYAVPEKIVRLQRPVGTLKKMSVAVLLDGLYTKDPKADPNADKAAMIYQKWSDEKLAEFKTIVAQSVGLDASRGDTIEIKNMEFRKEELDNADQQIAVYERRKMLMNLVQYLVVGLAIGFFFMLVVRPFIKWLTDNTVENMEAFLPKTIDELEQVQEEQHVEIQQVEEAVPVIVDKVDPEKVEGEMIKEKVMTIVESNPHKAAMVLHEWVMIPKPSSGDKQTQPGAGRKAG